jgi:asparagine synthase (glutamine-hydrolysing)
MCGLAGYIKTTAQNFSVDPSILEALHACIAYRGPDAHKIWFDTDLEVALVHRRLSIVDLSDAGVQPMFDKDRSVVICFNGEIYNYKALRAELEACGYQFVSQSDTEVFLYAFKQWGIACLDKLEGMFAGLLGDLKKQEWYLIRDRMGIKPLYFSLEGGYLSFGSEIKALTQLPWIKKELSPRGMYHYLTYMVTPAPMTLYKGIYKMPAGYYMKLDAVKNVSFTEWYSPLRPSILYDKKDLNNESFCVATIRTLMHEAVQKRMISDVPFGTFLSGGIDSSLIVALMSQYTETLKTFNVSFSDGLEYSEIEWARKVSKTYGTEHHEIIISEKEAYDFFTKMIHHLDEPVADSVSIPLYYVSKLLKDAGVTVVQVGEGSDELYCGYKNYVQYLDYQRPLYESLPYSLQSATSWISARACPKMAAQFNLFHKWNNGGGNSVFWSGALTFDEREKKNLVSIFFDDEDPVIKMIYPEMKQHFNSYAIVEYHLNKLYEQDPQADFLKSMIYLEFKQRLPELLLTRIDKMTMANSVEARVPFLDHKHVEFALQVPTHLKYKNGETKYILKKACEGILPHDVIYRKKMGFAAPSVRWLKEGTYFRKYFEDLLIRKNKSYGAVLNDDVVVNLFKKHQSTDLNYGLECWSLMNLITHELM